MVTATGPDAATYLHGQVSQNITGLAVGESSWTLLLQPQGRVEAWMRVTRVGEEAFWLDTDQGSGTSALERLNRFKLRVACDLELLEHPRITLLGAPPELESLGEPGEADDWKRLPFMWSGLDAVDLVGPGATIPPGVEEGSHELFEIARIRAGFPTMGAELTEQTIPAEAGIVGVSADFTKGCYVGQELVARVDSRGNNTPRRLRRLAGTGQIPDAGVLIHLANAEVGVVTSAAGAEGHWVGLGYIKRASAHLEAAEIGDGSVELHPIGQE